MIAISLKMNRKKPYEIFFCTILICIHIHLVTPKVVIIQRFKEPKKFDNIHHQNIKPKKVGHHLPPK